MTGSVTEPDREDPGGCPAEGLQRDLGPEGQRPPFLQALADGERSPAALAALGDYRLHASKAELAEA